MRKMFRLASWTFIAMLTATAAMATPTANNWSIDLQFMQNGKIESSPNNKGITLGVGTGTSANRVLHPPSLPGKDVTGDPNDVSISAAVADPVSIVADKKYVAAYSSVSPVNQNVWGVKVTVPEAGRSVSMAVDPSNFYSAYYPITIVDPKSGAVIDVRSASSSVSLYTSDAGDAPTLDGTGGRTLYVVAGAAKAFAASSGGALVGLAYTPGLANRPAGVNVKLYGAGCAASGLPTVSTNANGLFTIPNGIAAGTTYTVQLTKPYSLGGECSLATDANAAVSSQTACPSIYGGDVDQS